jgi:hypothetical protein
MLDSDLAKRNVRYRPYVFTEHGALMLSAVLKSERAAKMGIYIVRVFVRLREMLAANKDFARELERLREEQQRQEKQIRQVSWFSENCWNRRRTRTSKSGLDLRPAEGGGCDEQDAITICARIPSPVTGGLQFEQLRITAAERYQLPVRALLDQFAVG